MKRHVLFIVAVLAVAGAATSAYAWGTRTHLAIVSTAARVISKESGIELARLEKDIRSGAMAPPSEIERLIPLAATTPVAAIESEMYVLQSVRGRRVDPYFAYRLGVLGALVAQATAPLAEASPAYRDLYYADVEANIERTQLRPARRATVDPATYFAEVRAAANQRQELIISEYKSGVGFNGVAGKAISEDASRSVNAVADVMQTVLTGNVAVANRAESQIRDYVINAIEFYIARGNDAETESAYNRLVDLGAATVALQKRVGDMFYDAGKFERAIQEYEKVLEREPGRRDVVERISAYYIRVGDDALEADKLHPAAQSKVLEAKARIQERDDRLTLARQAIDKAQDNVVRADQLVFKRDYGPAIDLLMEARDLFAEVPEEFAAEYRKGQTGVLQTTSRLAQLRQELVTNASTLSGLGGSYGLKKQAEATGAELDKAALQALIDREYQSKLEELTRQSEQELYK
jgi:tetratricopeptide (TPR) repeat protein